MRSITRLNDVVSEAKKKSNQSEARLQEKSGQEIVSGDSSNLTVAYPFLPVAFVTALCIPLSFFFGTFRMSPYRVVLLITIIPAMISWLSGRAGKPTSIDFYFFFGTLWAALSLFVNTAISDVYQTAAIFFFETFGSYMLGRIYVRNYEQFLKFAKYLLGVFLVLLPFAIIETVGSKNIPLTVLGSIGNTYKVIDIGARMGLYRAQLTFEHPILWGIFASSLFGIITYTLGKGKVLLGIGYAVLTSIATISSVSSGALVSLAVQMIVMGWDFATKKTKNRWRIFGGIMITCYVVVDMISNRTPFQVFITYLTFSAQSSYNRINIWTFGTAEVWRHPIFGIGLGDWIRPRYMSASMDNFWLATTVRYGLPTFMFFAIGIIVLMRRMGQANLTNEKMVSARTGLMTTYIGIILSGCTVHFWNEMYCWIMFLFGVGHWCLAYPSLNKTAEAEVDTQKPSIRDNLQLPAKVLTEKKSTDRVNDKLRPTDPSLGSEKKWLK
jgi:O-Antigen ligase